MVPPLRNNSATKRRPTSNPDAADLPRPARDARGSTLGRQPTVGASRIKSAATSSCDYRHAAGVRRGQYPATRAAGAVGPYYKSDLADGATNWEGL